jgi:hypothetical protein
MIMPADVSIESAGDHAFDLTHLRQEGGADLVALLLAEADITEGSWRLRVEKKFACGAETRPVAVIGAKPWCCYLKIKPGDNNSAHSCSLLMPAGFRGDAVYEALKKVEGRIDRNWSNGRGKAVVTPAPDREDAPRLPAPEPAAEVVAPLAGEVPAQSTLRKWTKDVDRTQFTLLAIHELQQSGERLERDAFVTRLADALGWTGQSRHQMGGVFTTLVRQGLLENVYEGSKKLGYALTAKARKSLESLLTTPPPPPPPAVVLPAPPPAPAGRPPLAPAATGGLTGLEELATQLGAICQRISANRARRSELQREIERLDQEAAELGRLLADPRMHATLEHLRQPDERPARSDRA